MRMRVLLSGFAALGALAWSQAAAAEADAQEQFVPPVQQTDSRGVDLVAGSVRIRVPLASFGQGAPQLTAALGIALSGDGVSNTANFTHAAGVVLGLSLEPRVEETGTYYNDELGTFSNVVFPGASGAYLAHPMHYRTNPDGSYYTSSIGPTHMTRFTSPNDPSMSGVYDSAGNRGQAGAPIPGMPGSETTQHIDLIDFANGERWTFYRDRVTVPVTGPYTTTIARLRSVVSSRGYAIQFLYLTDVPPTSQNNRGTWLAPRKITPYNKTLVYCNESLLQECAAVTALPSTEIVYDSVAGTATIRQPGSSEGIELTFRKIGSNWGSIISMRHTAVPGSTATYQFATDNSGGQYVQRVTDADGQWNYFREIYLDDSGYVPEMHATATNPLGGVREVVGHTLFGQLTLLNDELPASHWVSVSAHPGNYRVYGWTNPQFDSVALDRDIRNNITEAVRYPASADPPITLYRATFPADCMNPRTCNRPTSTTDANQNVTDYTYAPEHGGVLTETGPAVNGVRPQKRYEYAQRTAWISNGAGGYAAAAPIWLLARERTCRTTAASGATCAGGAADEVITDYDYGPDSGPNNLLLRGQTVTATDGGVTTVLRTCYGYDTQGRRISETAPRAELASCP